MFATPSQPSIDNLAPEQLWLALITVSIVDIVTTVIGLEHGAPEGNPIAASAINTHGYWAMVPLKLVMLAIWRAGFRIIPYRYELMFLLGGIAFFGVVVCVNIAVIGVRMGVW